MASTSHAPSVGVDPHGQITIYPGGMAGRITLHHAHFHDKAAAYQTLVAAMWQYIQSLDDPWWLSVSKNPVNSSLPEFDVRGGDDRRTLIGCVTKVDYQLWSIRWAEGDVITVTFQDIEGDDLEVARALWRFAQPFRPNAR